MIFDGHTSPCYFAGGFCKPTTKTPFTLVWFSDDSCLIFFYKTLLDERPKSKIAIGLKKTPLYTLHSQ